MMQPRRPISRSSTPIEFAPLILDLEPEPEIKEAPKNKWVNGKLFILVVGIVIVGGVISYLGFRENSTQRTTQAGRTNANMVVTSYRVSVPSDEKKQIFTHGAKNAKLLLESIDGQDVLKVAMNDKVVEGITWVYEWTKNNDPFGKSDSIRGFKRGDTIAVKIAPFDGETYGNTKVLTTEIKNTVPRVIESQAAIIEGKKLTYQLKAVDSDGDTLTYSLVEGPPGVIVDKTTGVITWQNIPEDAQKLDLKVKIDDGQKGEIIYPATVNFSQPVKEKLTAQK